jgi:hypothetical protein
MAVPVMNTFSAVGARSVTPIGIDDQLKLLVNYARNQNDFAVNQYCTVSTVNRIQGIYPKFFAPDQIRNGTSDGTDNIWEDGTPIDLTKIKANMTRRTHIRYDLVRYKKEDTIGYLTIDQSEYDERRLRLNDLSSQMMTLRTLLVLNQAMTSTNYPTAHVATATAWGNLTSSGNGGFWNAGTVNNPTIGYALAAARNQIYLATNGKVKQKDLRLVLTPVDAGKMATSQEIRAYLAQQSKSLNVLKGEDPNANEDWMLPNPLYGFQVIIEGTPSVVGVQKQATADTQTYAMASFATGTGTAFIAARPGGVDAGIAGAQFSTIHILEKSGEAMQPYVEDLGERQKLHYCRVSDMIVPLVPAPESGALITNLFA